MPIMRKVKLLAPVILALSILPAFGLQEGFASWYGGKFNGRLTSSGEVFDTNEKTAAHRTLPFGAIVKVVNLDNGKFTIVKINDRGPFVDGRIIDLSRAAAQEIGMVAQGVARVSLEVLDYAASKDTFAVQVGAYNLEWNAEKAGKRLEDAGFMVFLDKNPLGITRVVVRGLDDKNLAMAKQKLVSLGFKNLVVRREKPEAREASAE
jgi:rare lipoprotein A